MAIRSNQQRTAGLLAVPRLVALSSLVLLSGSQVGCQSSPASSQPEADLPDAQEIQQRLDSVLDWTFDHRLLTLEKHAAWQIMHGALAYKREFLVERDGKMVSAVDHLLAGGPMTGWTTQPVWLDKERNQRGLRAILEEGSKTGQGHADQWLAVLAQCELPPNQAILVDGIEFTMSDYIAQVQFDVPRNMQREYSWTLIGLTAYLDTDAEWVASDGKKWSIARLAQYEVEQERDASACGGTHRMIGLAMSLRHHIHQQREVEGTWKAADELIKKSVADARRNQNPDGSFSTQYFAEGGSTLDLASALGSTGHVVEFLALALTEEELREPWVQRSVLYLCDLFDKTTGISLECGALYHAAHGLVLYRERVYGPRESWGAKASNKVAAQ